MTLHSSLQRRKRKLNPKVKLQGLRTHDEFLSRITKTLYYGNIPLNGGLSLPVSELASELFSEVKKECSLDRLHIDQAAQISRNACVSPCSLVLALLYLDRLKTCNSEYVEKVGPSDLFLVSMMVASKFLHDDGEEDEVYNDEWAASAGIELKEMNELEKDFLNAINWEVYVNEQAFWARLHTVEMILALREGKRRGWFSYTELSNLVDSIKLLSLAHTIITMSAVCLTSYTVSVLAMVGSTIVVNQLPAVTTHLLTTTLSPVTVPASLPFTCPDTPLIANQTIIMQEELNTDWFALQWSEPVNDSYPEVENDSMTDFYDVHINRKIDWSERKHWLTCINQFVHVTNTRPVDVLSY